MRKTKHFKKAVALIMALACTAVAALSVSAVETEQATEPISATEAYTEAATDPNVLADEGLSDSYDSDRNVIFTITSWTADYEPISEVGYTIYRVSDDLNVIPKLEEIQEDSLGEGIEVPLTDENGRASITLTPEQHGIYLVRNTTIPDTVETAASDFIISLPYTVDGEKWDYTAEASPKLVLKILETEPETEPTPTSPKTGGYVTASTADKGTATTGDMQTITIAIIVGVCMISFAVAMLLAAKQKKSHNK